MKHWRSIGRVASVLTAAIAVMVLRPSRRASGGRPAMRRVSAIVGVVLLLVLMLPGRLSRQNRGTSQTLPFRYQPARPSTTPPR